jgi:hypothetical protein
MSKTIKVMYAALSSVALYFIFLKFVNFWSITGLYFFLPTSKPFFLESLLEKIFESVNESIL